MADFFGRVYSDVIRNPNIPPTAKAIYAYLAVLCGAGNECFPSVATITQELAISRDTFYKYCNILVGVGVVTKRQEVAKNGRFSHTVYSLVRPCMNISDTEKTENGNLGLTVSQNTDFPYTVKPPAKENNQKESRKKVSENRFHNFQEHSTDYEAVQNALILKNFSDVGECES